MPLPLPEPCAVTAMPQTVAESGMAPHYTRPRKDGSRPGTYWFNTLRPTAGTGWDLEAVAFHETVPGHHSQLARLQRADRAAAAAAAVGHRARRGLGALRRAAGRRVRAVQRRARPSSARSTSRCTGRRGWSSTPACTRFGWSRQQARDYLLEHVALAEGFLTDEIDRYIAWPGQALAYLVGQREILRLRDRSRAALGDRFDLPAFNGALLDSGNLPMPC